MTWVNRTLVVLSSLAAFSGVGSADGYVQLYVPNLIKVGTPFEIAVSIQPPSTHPVKVTMIRESDITYSLSSFWINPGKRQLVEAKIKTTESGVDWIHASAEGYDDGWNSVISEFQGYLKLNATSPISYDLPTTMTVSIVDRTGKVFRFSGDMDLELGSADGLLGPKYDGTSLKLTIRPNSQSSPEFQFRPKSIWGGVIHISGVLSVSGEEPVLTQENFSLSAQPAWWVPIVLALVGGLTHALYKISRSTDAGSVSERYSVVARLIIASAVASFIGYLTANLDLLGLKLDPNVLRTYPLTGFLFSYFGLEVLLSGKLSPAASRSQPTDEKSAEKPQQSLTAIHPDHQNPVHID